MAALVICVVFGRRKFLNKVLLSGYMINSLVPLARLFIVEAKHTLQIAWDLRFTSEHGRLDQLPLATTLH